MLSFTIPLYECSITLYTIMSEHVKITLILSVCEDEYPIITVFAARAVTRNRVCAPSHDNRLTRAISAANTIGKNLHEKKRLPLKKKNTFLVMQTRFRKQPENAPISTY